MRYLPTIDLTPQIRRLLAVGALKLAPGQWVRDETGRTGRFLRPHPRTGTPCVSWVRPGDAWADQARRFHRACRKGFVGKYRPLYEVERAARAAALGGTAPAGYSAAAGQWPGSASASSSRPSIRPTSRGLGARR